MEKIKVEYYLAKALERLWPRAIKNSSIDRTSKVSGHCHIVNTTIKKYTYVNNQTTIVFSNIGAFTSIAARCVIGGASHPMSMVSTSPVFCEGKNIMKKHFSNFPFEPYKNTNIGNDVWIGTDCLIKGGISIGDGAVIGMGSIVTKDVGDYEIWAGNPAKLIRKRFSDEIIKELKKISWWEWDENKIKEYQQYFNDPQILIKKMNLL